MLGNYLQILSESLEKKTEILTKIEALSNEQSELIGKGADLADIDANMDAKAGLIEELNRLDDGFESLYDKIKDSIEQEKDNYKPEIAKLQQGITDVMDRSTSIQAIEARNKKAMEQRFAAEKKELSRKRMVKSVAYDYYKTSNKLQALQPQFVDSKK